MKRETKNIYFLIVAFLMIAPIALIFGKLDQLPATIFLSLPALYLLFDVLQWKRTAAVHFKVLMFFVIIISIMVIYYTLAIEFYEDANHYAEDVLPLDLLLHAFITGFIMATILTIVGWRFKGYERTEKKIMTFFTLILLCITIVVNFVS